MSRLSKRTPKYRKQTQANGTAVAFVELSGERVYLGPYGTRVSRDAYDREIARWLSGGRQKDHSRLTIDELLVQWLEYAERHYRNADGKDTGKLSSMVPSIRTLRHLYGDYEVDQFGPKSLKAVRQFVIDRGTIRKTSRGETKKSSGKPASRQYANSVVNQIRGIFRWGVSEELVSSETWNGLRSVRALEAGRCNARESDPVEPVEEAIIEATLRYLTQVVADMVQLQQATGMRPGEICQLRPCDVELRDDVWYYRPRQHKTMHKNKQRTVPIGPRGQAILKKYLDRAKDEPCFSPAESEQQSREKRNAKRVTPLSCGNRIGKNRQKRPKRRPTDQYTVNSYRRAIHRACDKAFPPDSRLPPKDKKAWISAHRWSPNQIRHTVATIVRKRFGLEAAQVVLGHTAANVTQVYAERDLAKAAEVIKEMG